MCSTMSKLIRKLFKNQNSKEMKISADPPTTKAPLPEGNKEFALELRDASPAHLMTEIKSFSKLSKYGIRKLESMEFEAGDYKWKLIIYLDGREMEKLGDDLFSVLFPELAAAKGVNISVYLAMVGTSSLPAGWEVNAFFNFFLYNHISDNYICFRGKTRRFHAINSEWGYSKLISKKILTDPSNGYLFNDNCVFGAEVFVIKKQPVVEQVSLLDFTPQCKHQWEISEFSKLEHVWRSEEFFVGGYNWQIILFPSGDSTAQSGYVSIFFRCVDSKSFAPHKRVYASCLFRFRNKLPNEISHSMRGRGCFTSSGDSWGFSEFKEIGDMGDPTKGFVVDDCCQLEIELSVLAQHEALKLE